MRFSRALSAVATFAALSLSGVAEAKNVFPYNHPDLDWYTIETEHFFVHYPVSKRTAEEGNKHYLNDEWVARKVAKVADEMWQPMCEQFDYYLTEKVHIVLLEQSDDLEGFTIPAWNWIEISGNPGGYFYRMRGRMEWFSDVLVHEFAHVVSLKRNAPFSEGTGAVSLGVMYNNGISDTMTGAEVNIADTDPFWWTEGGAEYWSDEAGYNWWTAARDANLRTTVLDDRLLTFEEWVTRIDKRDWGDGERGYQQGYSFGLYLRERFGPETYAKFSKTSAKKWRPEWETIVEDVTGHKLTELYVDWAAYLRTKYGKVRDDVQAQGEVAGEELETHLGDWRANDPASRAKWNSRAINKDKKAVWPNLKWERRAKRDRERARELTGTWDFYPRASADGKWFGEHTAGGGFQFIQYPEALFPGISGVNPNDPATADVGRTANSTQFSAPNYGSNFGHGWDFVAGRDAAVISGNEDMTKNAPFGWLRVETDGYDWGKLYVVDLSPNPKPHPHDKMKHHGEKLEKESRNPSHVLGGPRTDKWRFQAIPNTERGADPVVSADGKRVAYLAYAAGGVDLVVIDLDGSNKQVLTNFKDGSWLQGVSWSPDGKQLVFSMLRNFQQDLWVIDADGKNLHAITWDNHEDQDAHWAADGSIWFSSEPDGIFNIYRLDPVTKRVTQITNVVGGAECPSVTPEGNLLYTAFTAFGWKNYLLAKDEFLNADATAKFGVAPDGALVAQNLGYTEDLSYWAEKTEKYTGIGKVMPPTVVPIIRFDNDSMTNFGLSFGGQIYAQDFVEKNSLILYGMVGEDPLGVVGYTYQGWYPTITFQLVHTQAKFDYGFLLDDDDDYVKTTDDQAIYEGKNAQYQSSASVLISYPLNGLLNLNVFANTFEIGFKSTADQGFRPFMRGASAGAQLFYTNLSTFPYAANLRGGRAVDVTWTHGYRDIADMTQAGVDTDDGQVLDAYQFNGFEARWTEHQPVPKFWIDKLGALAGHGHTLQWDTSVGMTDRNVHFFDEYRGGGTHPYFVGNNSLQPNNNFAGYPPYSLIGETMIVSSLMYRAPLARAINQKIGPLYVYDIYGMVGGSAGNFWSFRPPEESDVGSYWTDGQGQRVAYDPSTVRREIPFVDKAYKNGNYLLTDVSAELRVSAGLFGGYWNSFVRVAWGLNQIRSIGDVNGDDVQDANSNGFGNSLSTEYEPGKPRVFLGLGTGW